MTSQKKILFSFITIILLLTGFYTVFNKVTGSSRQFDSSVLLNLDQLGYGFLNIWNIQYLKHNNLLEHKDRLSYFESDNDHPIYYKKKNLRVKISRDKQGNQKFVQTDNLEEAIYVSNSHGLKGREVLPKEKDEFRILCLGGSTTEGVGLRYFENWTYLLEKNISAKTGLKIRVINAGFPMVESLDTIEYSKQFLKNLAPDLVLYYAGFNDVTMIPRFNTKTNCEMGSCWPHGFSSPLREALLNSSQLRNSYNFNLLPKPIEYTVDYNAYDTAFKKFSTNIDILKSIYNKPFVHFSIIYGVKPDFTPTESENVDFLRKIYANNYPLTPNDMNLIFNKFNRSIYNYAKHSNSYFIDSFTNFPIERVNFMDDYHFSKEGAIIFAKNITYPIIDIINKINDIK